MNNEKALNWLYNNHPDFTWDMVDFALPISGGTYCIYDNDSGVAYFGRASNVRNRIRIHKRELRERIHCNSGLQSAFDNGGDLMFFCITRTEHQDTALLLESHWANVFGRDRVFNLTGIGAIVSKCDYINSSDESIYTAAKLGYPFAFDSCFNANSIRSLFSRQWVEREEENAPVIEAARKLIL